MTQIITRIIPGRELTNQELHVINQARQDEFASRNPITPQPNNEDWDKLYFLTYDKARFVAFGRLHTILVTFFGYHGTLLGIATIISLEKGQGYGKLLMKSMVMHIQSTQQTAIGFCDPSVSEFYKKCGLKVLSGGNRFVAFRDNYGNDIPARYPTNDLLYISGSDHLIEQALQSNIPIIAFRSPW